MKMVKITRSSWVDKGLRTLSNSIFSKKLYFFTLCIIFTTILLVFYQVVVDHVSFQENLHTEKVIATAGYLVSSSKCLIVDVEAFNNETMKFYKPEPYRPCSKLDLLTHLSVQNKTITLRLDKKLIPSYSKNGVSCTYTYVRREPDNKEDPDNAIGMTHPKRFEHDVILTLSETVKIDCVDKYSRDLVYENVHTAWVPTEKTEKKISNSFDGFTPISVIFIGLDSISRLNFIRTMPKTHRYLEDHDWISLKGYNKIASNTFPNLIAILTGYEQTYAVDVCNPDKVGKLDDCPIIWKEFDKLGYITAYAEDDATIGTFNYLRKGFKNAPTDYYARPYIIAAELLKQYSRFGMIYCTGPETSGERILNLATNFSSTFKDHPHFGFFWTNTFSHSELNQPSGMDSKVKHYLETFEKNGVFDKSVVIFLSDHGMRFGDIRNTKTGWYEERLPFIYFSFPPWFKERFSSEYKNILGNVNKLTTPYDLHMTLQQMLVMSGFNHSIKQAQGCPKCKSLFENIDHERSCPDASIPWHWCTCEAFQSVNTSNQTVQDAAKFVLQKIDEVILKTSTVEKCANYTIGKIVNAGFSGMQESNSQFLLLSIETIPKAIFEATLIVDYSNYAFSLGGSVSRLDSYAPVSKCVKSNQLKKYCYCIDSSVR